MPRGHPSPEIGATEEALRKFRYVPDLGLVRFRSLSLRPFAEIHHPLRRRVRLHHIAHQQILLWDILNADVFGRFQVFSRLLAGHGFKRSAVEFGCLLLLRAEFTGRGQCEFVHPSLVRFGGLDADPVALALQHLHQGPHPGLANAFASVARLCAQECIADIYYCPLAVIVLRLHLAGYQQNHCST